MRETSRIARWTYHRTEGAFKGNILVVTVTEVSDNSNPIWPISRKISQYEGSRRERPGQAGCAVALHAMTDHGFEFFYGVANERQDDATISHWLHRKQVKPHSRDLPIKGGHNFKLREGRSKESDRVQQR